MLIFFDIVIVNSIVLGTEANQVGESFEVPAIVIECMEDFDIGPARYQD